MSERLAWRIGDVRVTRIEEIVARMPLHHLLPAAAEADLTPHHPWLVPDFLTEEGDMLISIHALVIESAGRRIVVDTCVGERVIPGFEALTPDESHFLDEMDDAGFPLETIDTVLCTHLHFDHVGWNTRRQGDEWVPTFPNARYLFAAVEWDHWSREERPIYTATLDDAVRPIIDAGLADLVEVDHHLTDEVWLEATPGHTPGHVAVRIESRGERALITGDLTHHPVQWAEPDWPMPADTDPEQARQTRHRVFAEHRDRDTLVIGTHYAPPCAGYLESGDGGRGRFRARR